jgi:hypothetical protein
LRCAAFRAYIQAEGDLEAAKERFDKQFPKHGLLDLDQYILFWYKRAAHDPRANPERPFDDLPRAGRPKQVDMGKLEAVAAAIRLGTPYRGVEGEALEERRHFFSWCEAFADRDIAVTTSPSTTSRA